MREFFNRHAVLLAEFDERDSGIGLTRPDFLLMKNTVDHAEEIVLLAGAFGENRRDERIAVERKMAIHEFRLAGVDVILLQFAEGMLVKIAAMTAGQRRIFNNGYRRRRQAKDMIALQNLRFRRGGSARAQQAAGKGCDGQGAPCCYKMSPGNSLFFNFHTTYGVSITAHWSILK